MYNHIGSIWSGGVRLGTGNIIFILFYVVFFLYSLVFLFRVCWKSHWIGGKYNFVFVLCIVVFASYFFVFAWKSRWRGGARLGTGEPALAEEEGRGELSGWREIILKRHFQWRRQKTKKEKIQIQCKYKYKYNPMAEEEGRGELSGWREIILKRHFQWRRQKTKKRKNTNTMQIQIQIQSNGGWGGQRWVVGLERDYLKGETVRHFCYLERGRDRG